MLKRRLNLYTTVQLRRTTVHRAVRQTHFRQWPPHSRPCADTPGCVMPECCGIVSGELTVLSLTYTATRNATSGVAQGLLTGVALTAGHKDIVSGLLKMINPLKFIPVTVPNLAVAYSYDMCYKGPKQDWNVDFCPQVIGNNYTYEGYFLVPTNALTTSVCMITYVMTCQINGLFMDRVLWHSSRPN